MSETGLEGTMAENVNPTRSVEAGMLDYGLVMQAPQTKSPPADNAVPAAAGVPSREVEAGGEVTKSLSNFILRFRVDENTHDVTVLILDSVSKKVVRSIPPEEMGKMDPGELLQLFA